MARLILALDQGTSSSRAIVYDAQAQPLGSHALAFTCRYPQPGWVEVDALTLWQSQLAAIEGALANTATDPQSLAAIGLTNQRETVMAWDRSSGEPLTPAIVWQCRRTTEDCQALRAQGLEEQIRERTGLLLDPYFSASKMRWLLQRDPALRRGAEAGTVAFGTVDSWIVWRLSGGKAHVTDASNASRTLLCNLHSGDWDRWLLDAFDIPLACLPRICDSAGVLAHSDASILGAAVPICGIAGDQQAALFGQACVQPGMAKNTYGTGCFLLLNTGAQPVRSSHGLLSTVAWRIGGELTYALEGSVFMAGALIQWLRDELGIIDDAAQSEALAESVSDAGGVHLVPAFTGLGAPHWDPQARGMISGLTRGSTRAHIVRAAIEAVAWQNFDLLQAMQADTGEPLQHLRIDGGMCNNNLLCQFQADVLQIEVDRAAQSESSALGAALLAGLGCGLWDWDQLAELWRGERSFRPSMATAERDRRLAGWQQALRQVRHR